jgi:hypothetical protein
VCFDGLPAGSGEEAYTMVGIVTRRGKKKHPPVWVHMAREPAEGRMRVIGIWRE